MNCKKCLVLYVTFVSSLLQRRDYSALTKFLPPKFEYVIAVRLSKVQIELYRSYFSMKGLMAGDNWTVITKGAKLFSDYQALMKIWTHPWILKLDEIRAQNKVGRPSVIKFSSPCTSGASFMKFT